MTQEQAFNIMKTGVNVFLTGSAGSGKTFLLNKYINYLKSQKIPVAVTASTGIAATHMNGLTIHSWSGIGIHKELNDYDLDNLLNKEYLSKRIRNTAVLIIDEISMLEDRQLDMAELVCRKIKMNDLPFGGMQVILSGDFFQLPPVVKNIENKIQTQNIFTEDSNNMAPSMAINSMAWRSLRPAICYLSEQYRQNDNKFLEILNLIRANQIKDEHCDVIQKRLNAVLPVDVVPTKLYTHNVDVDVINNRHLEKINGEEKVFKMETSGNSYLVEILKKGCLAPENLHLKIGAEVMFLKNNFEKGYVNGTRGKVYNFLPDNTPVIAVGNGEKIIVEKEFWIIEEKGRQKASISQLPLRLAWAITIHKSQGMSLDYAEIDLSKTFAYGMGYVALSRVKTLSGIRLVGFDRKSLLSDPEILKLDEMLQEESRSNEMIFGKLNAEEQRKMENDFINRAGAKSISRTADDNLPKKYSVTKIRERYPKAYTPWTEDDDNLIRQMFAKESSMKEMQDVLGRKRGAINSRLSKLGLK